MRTLEGSLPRDATSSGGGGYALGFEAVAEFCFRAFYQLELFLAGCEPGEREAAIDKTGEKLALMAQWFSARIKDAAFREEQEWRFICRNPSAPDRAASYKREFRAVPRGLIPFVRLPLGIIGKDASPDGAFPLSRIRVGPTANIELASRAINYILKDNGFGIRAETPPIPLRA